eukprot:TRINITY_DN3237_c0_g1_i1.p1 TRINITY_DN3237_c0_g1~~TRINITY_DN3237_c0_g1_i1.p1  ORF type:complete len:486 (-),score=95.97 TRINITY_DN3237_c0_g1_i1:1030-2487(-)
MANDVLSAASSGNVAELQSLIQSGANIEAKSEVGFTPLALAARGHHAEAAKFLLQSGANANSTSDLGTTPLMLAAACGSKELILMLLAHKSKVNALSKHNDCALLWAAAGGHAEVVSVLIEHGANVNAANSEGITPLMVAAMVPCRTTLKILLDRGADAFLRDVHGRTAVAYAMSSSQGAGRPIMVGNGDISFKGTAAERKLEGAECEALLRIACEPALNAAENELLGRKTSKAAKAHERRKLRRAAERERRATAAAEDVDVTAVVSAVVADSALETSLSELLSPLSRLSSVASPPSSPQPTQFVQDSRGSDTVHGSQSNVDTPPLTTWGKHSPAVHAPRQQVKTVLVEEQSWSVVAKRSRKPDLPVRTAAVPIPTVTTSATVSSVVCSAAGQQRLTSDSQRPVPGVHDTPPQCSDCIAVNTDFHQRFPIAAELDISCANVAGVGIQSLSMAQLQALGELYSKLSAANTEAMLELARALERQKNM